MKSAVDEVFTVLESNPQDFLSTFDKTVTKVAKKHGVKEKDILKYFDKERVKLLEDLSKGEKKMRVYRQMKMYNDETLNPVLYKKDD